MATSFRLRAVCVTLCLLAAAPRLAAQSNPKVAARDQLVITVTTASGVKESAGKYPVSVDGAIEFPQLGRVPVAGLTARDVGELLGRKLKAADIVLNPQVTVELEQTPTKKVTVNGAVRNQGALAFGGELTLLDAIVRAGGRTPEAADVVLVVRAAQMPAAPSGPDTSADQMIEVNVRELENGVLQNNLVLGDGDAIFVRRAQAVTITGFVRNVGAYTVEPGASVEQALALAGGIIPERGSEKRIEITRKVNGKTTTFKVKKTDLVKPGDIIKVGPKII